MNAHHALKVPSRTRNLTRADRLVMDLNHAESIGKVRSWYVRSEPGRGRVWVVEVRGGSTKYLGTKDAERLAADLTCPKVIW